MKQAGVTDAGTLDGDLDFLALAGQAATPASTAFTVGITSALLDAEVSYISGVTAAGSLATRSFWTDAREVAHKWGSRTAGTASGALTYAFDAASAFTATEMQTFRSALALWTGYANVTFTQASSTSGASVILARGPSGSGAVTSDSYSTMTGRIATLQPGVTISIDTSAYGFDLSGSFNVVAGYGLATIEHELGHALGLGHGGNYNGTVNSATDQYSQFDTRLYSTMSYITPFDSTAQYYGMYSVTGTGWNGAQNSTTPMMVDIAAIQRLYGASQNNTFAGGQTFGFNSNISGDAAPFFDFTRNTAPIITLYDRGTGNTLDLSGYSTDATIDLRDGHFSSFAGLVNNLGIAVGTEIDRVVGGFGVNRFYTNGKADTIVGNGSSNTVYFANNRSDYTVVAAGTNATVASGGVVNTLTNVQSLVFADQTMALACYAAGTTIATARGAVPIERLQAGDRAVLAGGGTAPVLWIGQRQVDCTRLTRPELAWPVRFARDAMGPGVPSSPLLLSPEHAVFLEGVLIPARCLLNGATIVQTPVDHVHYYHVELDRHGVVLAHDLAAESWLDCGNRGMFANAPGPVTLHPARADPILPGCAPRHDTGPLVEAARRALLHRAIALGHALCIDPDLQVVADGRPIPVVDGAYAIPAGTGTLCLMSRSGVPAHHDPATDDRRRLGVLLGGLVLRGAGECRQVDAGHPALSAGFWDAETHDGRPVRWTDGAAVLPARLWAGLEGPVTLELRLAMAQPSWRRAA